MNKTMSILQLRKDALPQFSSFCIAFAMCVTLISCNTNEATELSSGDDNNKGSSLKSTNPYDPPVLIVANDVGKWVEEQLASEGSEKRLIMISDMYMPEDTESAAGLSATIDSDGKVEYFLNGSKISAEEYSKKWIEYDTQRTDKNKRNLSIPGEIIYEDSRSWTVLITAKELSELLKKYDKLAIDFFLEATPDV